MGAGNQGLRGEIQGTRAKKGMKVLRCNIKILRENKVRRRKDDGEKQTVQVLLRGEIKCMRGKK